MWFPGDTLYSFPHLVLQPFSDLIILIKHWTLLLQLPGSTSYLRSWILTCFVYFVFFQKQEAWLVSPQSFDIRKFPVNIDREFRWPWRENNRRVSYPSQCFAFLRVFYCDLVEGLCFNCRLSQYNLYVRWMPVTSSRRFDLNSSRLVDFRTQFPQNLWLWILSFLVSSCRLKKNRVCWFLTR